jgi:predicted DNA-binding transcriptional regulator YafY
LVVLVSDYYEKQQIKAWKYINTLPLHHSQEEIKITDEYSVFRYYIRPTYDFRQELLSHGAEIEVLSPQWFREEVSAICKEMNKLYQ